MNLLPCLRVFDRTLASFLPPLCVCRVDAVRKKLADRYRQLTQRAPDLGYAPRFLSMFLALSFFRFGGEPRPAHLPLTRAVRRLEFISLPTFNIQLKLAKDIT